MAINHELLCHPFPCRLHLASLFENKVRFDSPLLMKGFDVGARAGWSVRLFLERFFGRSPISTFGNRQARALVPGYYAFSLKLESIVR